MSGVHRRAKKANSELTEVEECIGKLAYFQRLERAIGRLMASLQACRHCVKRTDKPPVDDPFYVPTYCGHKVKVAYDQLELLLSKMIAGEECEALHHTTDAMGQKPVPLNMLRREIDRIAASDLCCR